MGRSPRHHRGKTRGNKQEHGPKRVPPGRIKEPNTTGTPGTPPVSQRGGRRRRTWTPPGPTTGGTLITPQWDTTGTTPRHHRGLLGAPKVGDMHRHRDQRDTTHAHWGRRRKAQISSGTPPGPHRGPLWGRKGRNRHTSGTPPGPHRGPIRGRKRRTGITTGTPQGHHRGTTGNHEGADGDTDPLQGVPPTLMRITSHACHARHGRGTVVGVQEELATPISDSVFLAPIAAAEPIFVLMICACVLRTVSKLNTDACAARSMYMHCAPQPFRQKRATHCGAIAKESHTLW